MNRISRELLSEWRNIPARSGRDRRWSLAGVEKDENLELDLFLKSRGSALIGSANRSDGQDEPTKLERVLIGSAKFGKSGMDDLLNADNGKHDYDWLLTPPGTPRGPSSDTSELPLSSVAPKRSSTVRSVSTTRATRVVQDDISIPGGSLRILPRIHAQLQEQSKSNLQKLHSSQSENGHSTRPARSSSVTRSSISSSNFSNTNRTSILNTSSASLTSRPSTPGSRPATLSTTRPSTPTSRSIPTRSPTPVKTRPTPSSAGLKSGPSHSSRPSTPTSRTRIPTNSISSSNSSAARLNSRSSTPTRQPVGPTPALTTGRSPSVGRLSASNGRNSAPSSRPSSPSPRPRAPVRPADLPDFPLDAPPNLRTKLPERSASAGRMRPGVALTVRSNSNSEAVASVSSNRRLSVPIVSRGRFPDNPPKVLSRSNGHQTTPPEIRKPVVSEAGTRKPIKPAAATESTGFGRTISKKSLDMALRHMDIRQSMGGIRAASLFPHSIRSAASKGRPARVSEPIFPVTNDADLNGNCNETISGDCNRSVSYNGDSTSKSSDRESLMTRESMGELDLYGSSHYDAMLLKEDSKNTNWLHSVEDRSDQSPVFDHRFEPLPEPFDPL